MHPSMMSGAEIRIAQLGDGRVQAWVHYMLDVDGGVFARTVPLNLAASSAQPGSQQWTKELLQELLELL